MAAATPSVATATAMSAKGVPAAATRKSPVTTAEAVAAKSPESSAPAGKALMTSPAMIKSPVAGKPAMKSPAMAVEKSVMIVKAVTIERHVKTAVKFRAIVIIVRGVIAVVGSVIVSAVPRVPVSIITILGATGERPNGHKTNPKPPGTAYFHQLLHSN